MENDLVNYEESYYIQRFDDDQIKINKREFEGLKKMLSDPDVRFVELANDRIVNISSIKEIIKIDPPKGNATIRKLKEKELTPEQRKAGLKKLKEIRKNFPKN